MVSSYQLAILAQFNEGDQHSFSDIATATKLSEPLLKAQLNVLVKQKVLLQDGDDYDLNLSGLLILLLHYHSKRSIDGVEG